MRPGGGAHAPEKRSERGMSSANNDFPYEIPQGLVDGLLAGRRVIVAGHVTPDADCLGSNFALARALRAGGHEVMVAVRDRAVPRRLEFMLELAGVPILAGAAEGAYDTAVVLDTAKPSRVNLPGKWEALAAAGERTINIDHHETNEGFAKVNFVVPEASSTCEIVYFVLRRCGLPIDATTASLLYAGVWGDTSGFSLPSSSKAAFRAAAGIVEAHADVELIGQRMCRSLNAGEFALQRVVYDNTKLAAGGRIAYSTVSLAELSRTGCTASDIDDQVGIVRLLDGVQIALLFSEGHAGKIRINFRGERGISVLALAQQFGGGGHDQASGAILDGTVEQVAERVVGAAERYLDALGAA